MSKQKTAMIVVSDEEGKQNSNNSILMAPDEPRRNSKTELEKEAGMPLEMKKSTPPGKRSRGKNDVNSETIPPNKRNRTELDYLNNPAKEESVQCRTCGMEVLSEEINTHSNGFCKEGIDGSVIDCDNTCVITETEEENSQKALRSQRETSKSEVIAQNKKRIDSSSSIAGEKYKNVQDLKPFLSEPSTMSRNKEFTKSSSKKGIASNRYTKFDSSNINNEEEEFAKSFVPDTECDSGTDRCLKTLSKKKCELTEKMENEKEDESEKCENDSVRSMEGLDEMQETSDSTAVCNLEDTKEEDTSIVVNKERNKISEENTDKSDRYLKNFKSVLSTVLSNEEDSNLFNDADHKIIKHFQEFPTATQKLYIRLFQKKPGWFRCSKLDNPKIADNLVKAGFLDNEEKLTDLRETLQLLSLSDIRDLAIKAQYVIKKSSQRKGQNKQNVIDSLIKHAKSQNALDGSGSALLLKRAKEKLGAYVRVSLGSKSVFSRLLLLFSMNIIPEDEDNKFKKQSQQLSTILLGDMDKSAYQKYNITRQVPVFKDRDHVIKFAEAYQEKHEMSVALEGKGGLETAYSFYPKAAECFNKILATLKTNKANKTLTSSSSLPIHLRCFTPEWVYTKMCYLGVEVLQKKRLYEEAVKQLGLLLEQDTYCADCRGLWWKRLALNVHQHLKQPIKALQIIRQGLEDSHVRFGRRLALVQRAKKIMSSASFNKIKNEDECGIDEALLIEPNPAKSVKISGKRADKKGFFICREITKTGQVKEDRVVRVEEYALSHYRQQGYDKGIHGETSTFRTLYGLFFWDIIFLDGKPDVFRGKFQSEPLDINFDTFYECIERKELIDKRLNDIENCSTEDLPKALEQSWIEHEGQICSGVSWERFDDVEQAKQLVSCFGGKVLSGVFKHFAEDMRHWRSGMPDLVVWNSSNLEYRIVEVKGPRDRLSTKQQIWLDELASFGATVEVCYVTAS